MRASLSTLAALAAAAAGLLAAAPSNAAADSATSTIGLLEAQGFDVRIDRIGSAPLSECAVTDVRNPQERTQIVQIDRRGRDVFLPVVVSRTVTVSLDCSRR